MIQENNRQDVNGSSDKPFPQERNFTINAEATIPNAMTAPAPAMGGNPSVEPQGQIKYARREGVKSIYKDVTRNTANDNAASAKAEGSTMFEVEKDGEGESM